MARLWGLKPVASVEAGSERLRQQSAGFHSTLQMHFQNTLGKPGAPTAVNRHTRVPASAHSTLCPQAGVPYSQEQERLQHDRQPGRTSSPGLREPNARAHRPGAPRAVGRNTLPWGYAFL